MLYSDPFRGYLDYTVKKGGSETYREIGDKLRAIAPKTRTYGYVFDMGAKLCDLMELKYELGIKTREAYQKGDKVELRRLADNEYALLPAHIRAFSKAFEKKWMKESKPCGFEYYSFTLGGLEERARYQRKRLQNYLDGKVESIDELSWELLPYKQKEQSWWYKSFASCIDICLH
jgi:hypothetical protein